MKTEYDLKELEGLRSDVSEFKSRLNQEEIVSEQMMKQTTRRSFSWLYGVNMVGLILGIVFTPIMGYLLHTYWGRSWLVIIPIFIIVAADSLFAALFLQKFSKTALASKSLLAVYDEFKRFSMINNTFEILCFPLTIAWFYWVFPNEKLLYLLLLFIPIFCVFLWINLKNKKQIAQDMDEINRYRQ